MNNVIDYFTGLTIEKIDFTDSNNEQKDHHGVYLGHIGDGNAIVLNNLRNDLILLQHQIDVLNEKQLQIHKMYWDELNNCLGVFGTDPLVAKLNLETDDVFMNEKGHLWIVFGE